MGGEQFEVIESEVQRNVLSYGVGLGGVIKSEAQRKVRVGGWSD